MKTAINELLNLIPNGYDIKQYISENDPDEKMLDEWLCERIYKNKNWLEKEKQQIIDAHEKGQKDALNYNPERHGNEMPTGSKYFYETFNVK